MALGEKIKQARVQKKLSQNQLGEIIGIHSKHISKIENNKMLPHIETIKKLATALNVSIDYLVFDDVPKNTELNKFKDAELVDLIFQTENLSEKDKESVKNILNALISRAETNNFIKSYSDKT